MAEAVLPAGSNIALFNSGPALPMCRGPPAATSPHSNESRVAFSTLRSPRLRLFGDRRRGRSVENALPLSFWSGSVRQPTRNRPPSLINGTALTGLSTLCPRRRSPVNQVAVVKGWITPSTNLADGRSGPSRMPRSAPEHRPIQSARAAGGLGRQQTRRALGA